MTIEMINDMCNQNESTIKDIKESLNKEMEKIESLEENIKSEALDDDVFQKVKEIIENFDLEKRRIPESLSEDMSIVNIVYNHFTTDVKEIMAIISGPYIFNYGYDVSSYIELGASMYDVFDGYDDYDLDSEEYQAYLEYDSWYKSLENLDDDLAEFLAKTEFEKDGWILDKEERWAFGLDPDAILFFRRRNNQKPKEKRCTLDMLYDIEHLDYLDELIKLAYRKHSKDLYEILVHIHRSIIIPLTYEQAVESNKCVFLVYDDGSEAAAESLEDIERHYSQGGLFGYEGTGIDILRSMKEMNNNE